MWDTIIDCKLNNLRIHHNKPYFLRALLIYDGIDQRVYTYTLSTTCGTGNDHMRHLGYINKNRLSCNGPAKNHRKLHLHVSGVFPCSFDHILEAYYTCLGVRYFYTYSLFSRNRSKDSYFLSSQSIVKLVFPCLYLAYYHALGKFQLIHGHCRAFDDV